MSEEISNADAITIVSGQLPDEGMTLREFIRRAVIARGDTGDPTMNMKRTGGVS